MWKSLNLCLGFSNGFLLCFNFGQSSLSNHFIYIGRRESCRCKIYPKNYKEGGWNISNAVGIYVFLSPETKNAGLISRSFLLSGLLFWSIA